MKELTKAEEQIIQVLWDLEKGFVKDILEQLPDPRPAYTTVSTIIRILEKKGVVGYKAYGKTYEYYPLITREEYSAYKTQQVVQNYFSGSIAKLVSHFTHREDISLKEADEIIHILENLKKGKDAE